MGASPSAHCVAKDSFWAWWRSVAAYVGTQEVLALRQVCRAFAGKAGMKLLRHHAATIDRAGERSSVQGNSEQGCDS